MKYLLDTNTCIRYLNQRSAAVVQHFKQTAWSEIAVCSVIKAEMFAGALRSNNPEKTLAKQKDFLNHFESYSFDDNAAERYAIIRADLESRGLIIGPNDLLIASIAVVNGLTLVTHNVNEFSRVSALRLEDWEIE